MRNKATKKFKKFIKRSLNRRKTNNRRKPNNRRKRIILKGGNAKNTLTPSPIMNAYYDTMNTPNSLINTLNGVEEHSNSISDPTKGHNILN